MEYPLTHFVSLMHCGSRFRHAARAAAIAAFAISLTGCNAVLTAAPQTAQQQAISLQAATVSVAPGGVDMFTAIQQGAQVSGGQWTVTGGAVNGTIDATGLYHAPASVTAPALVSINYLLSSQSASIDVIVVASASTPVSVEATQPTVQVQGSDAFAATQQGTSVTSGAWVVLGGSANGSIDAAGNYTAPAVVPNPNTISVGYIFGDSISVGSVTIVDAAPAIGSIAPAQIVQLSTSIQVAGSGFVPGSIVSAGSTLLPTTYVDASHLSATITLINPLNQALAITVTNPGNGFSQSAAYDIQAVFPSIRVQPATLSGGPITLAISGSGFTAGDVVTLNGSPMLTTVNSSTTIAATGFLTPWSTGSVVVQLSAGDGEQPIAAQTVPIQPTPVSYDAASRFATQAAMGQRPDVVQALPVATISFQPVRST